MSAATAHLAPPTCAPSHVALPVEDRAAVIAAYVRAFQRAKATKIKGYRTGIPGTVEVTSGSEAGKTYLVTRTGPKWFEWSCPCQGGAAKACQHRAVAVYCTQYGVYAVRPVLCENCNTDPATESGHCEGCAAAVHGPVEPEPTSIEDERTRRRLAYRGTQVALRKSGVDPLAECYR